MRTFTADLHIHSCLSPCAELDMTPRSIVRRAAALGLDIIAIADHNTAEHVEVASVLGRASGLTVIPAMELCSSEEAHVLALFDSVATAREVQEIIYAHLPAVPTYRHDETSQPVVNEADEILFFSDRPLINATRLSLDALVALVHERRGLVIASHIDRDAFSVVSQLGFIPEGLPLDAVEVSYFVKHDAEAAALSGRYPAVSFSDAHHVEDIGRRATTFLLEDPTLDEIARCLTGEAGRRARIRFEQ